MREGSLAAVAAISAMLFGSVEPWSQAIVGIASAAVFLSFAFSMKTAPASGDAREIIVTMTLLLLYPVFQLIPLPVSAVGLLHRRFTEIVSLGPAPPGFHSVTLYPFATGTELSRMLICFMVFSAAAFGVRGREKAHRVIRVLSIFGFAIALFGIIQHATWNGKIYWFRSLSQGGTPFGPFVNRNHFAGFLGMLIPLALGIAFTSRSLEKKIMYSFFAVVMAIGLFFSLSRGGIVSFFAAVLVFSFVIFARGWSGKKLIIPVFLFVLVLAVYLLSLGISPVIERFARTDVTGEQRLAAWLGTLSAFADFPAFGSGLGTFEHVFKIYKPGSLTLLWDHAHNDYLELLLEAGIAGTVLAAIFLYFVIGAILRRDWQGRGVYMGAAFIASIAAMAVHSAVDFNLHILSNAVLFSLILGLGVATAGGKAKNES